MMRIFLYMLCYMVVLSAQEDKVIYDLRISHIGDKNAPITIKTHYCRGTTIKCGKQTKTSSDGKLLFSANYKNGKYDGEVLSYYPNGALQETRTYIDGKEHGKRVFYHTNGKIFIEQFYVSNQREGEGKKYYENGILQTHFIYKNDRLDGLRQEFDKRGILTYETLYKDGKKQSMKRYDVNGNIIEEKNCLKQTCY